MTDVDDNTAWAGTLARPSTCRACTRIGGWDEASPTSYALRMLVSDLMGPPFGGTISMLRACAAQRSAEQHLLALLLE